MTRNFKFDVMGGLLATGLMALAGTAQAVDIKCGSNARYMLVPDTQVSACLGAGTGNINGTAGNDGFLDSAAGAGYALISKSDGANPFSVSYTQGTVNGNTVGTWTFNVSAWQPLTKLGVGFKFGNNAPDNWFVYQVLYPTANGIYTFINPAQGGGLSHMNLYRSACAAGTPGCRPPDIKTPEPGTLALLGLGLLGLGFSRRRAG